MPIMMNKKLSILILSPIALENGRGGEISSMELASGLNKFYNVTIVDTNIFTGKKLVTRREINNKLKGVKKSRHLKFATLNILKRNFNFPYPWEIIKLYRMVKNKDVFYTSYFNIKTNILLIFFNLLLRNVKIIIGYRKPLHSDKLFSLYNLKYTMSILFLSLFKKRIYHHTLSYQAKKYLENFYSPNSVVHITHGIELEKYKNNGNEKKRSDTLNFIYVGYLDDVHKGVSVLIQAIDDFLKENYDLRVFFEFCGMGPLESEVKKLESKYLHKVKFHGYVSNDLISNYYKKSDVYLFTSRVEPFPRALIEALGAELLILSSRTIGSIELLRNKEYAFFMDVLSPNNIVKKINHIYSFWLENPKRFRELQKEGKEYVFESYTFERELNEFKKLIDNIKN